MNELRSNVSQIWHKRLTIIGTIILLIGLGSALAISWRGAASNDLRGDFSRPEDTKKGLRNVESNFGALGLWSYQLTEDLKQPSNQAILVLVVTGVAASGCFYFAHLWKRHG